MKTHLLLSAFLVAGLPVIAKAQTPVTPVNWNHEWKFFHPMGAMPADAGNFATTWYLPDADYDSPLPFGADPEVVGVPATTTSYDSGIGTGPFGYDTIAYTATANAQFAAIAGSSLLTTPASGSRYTAYYKTTFVVPEGGAAAPKLEFLWDDGGYLYLDGVRIAAINIAAINNAAVEAYTATATTAEYAEQTTYILDLAVGGARTLDGVLTPATNKMAVNVLSPVGFLSAGTHTLAASAHNASATSSDSAFALKLTATAGGCSFSTAAGTVTRDPMGTPGNAADDTISASVAVTANAFTAPTWNVTANVPGQKCDSTARHHP